MQLPTSTIDLAFHVEPLATGFSSALDALPEICVQSQSCEAAEVKSITLKVPRTPPRVFSFTFPEAPVQSALAAPKVAGIAAAARSRSERTTTVTRIKPPGDIIKLEDRLYYVL